MPSIYTLILLFMLTTAHAVLMVSAAIVISVQSTSVRAANLLASFIVIPVALMMQGESVLLFWGTDQVLWLAVVAVIIIAGLLVRLGIAHFQREYLLGREFDSLNLRWLWQMFWQTFKGEGNSLFSWYRLEVPKAMRKLSAPLLLILVMAVIGFLSSYYWAMVNVPRMLPAATDANYSQIMKGARESIGLAQAGQHLSALYLFANNVRATLLILLAGLVSFSVLGMLIYLVNVGLIGGVLGVFKLIGYSPLVLFAAGLLPHGIFEIPALMIASAIVLRMAAVLVAPQLGKSMGQVVLELLADWAKVFLGVVMPLLGIAALVEAYITPLILAHVLN